LAALNGTQGNFEEALKWSDIARNEIQAYLNRESLEPGELGMWVGWMAERIRLDRTMGKQKEADRLFEELRLYIEQCANKYRDYQLFHYFQTKLPEYECAELK
jgi:hypothetical protein